MIKAQNFCYIHLSQHSFFYTFFQYLIQKKILITDNLFKYNYYYYFAPALFLFILAVDHGRSINLILTHLLSFYLVLDFKEKNFKLLYEKIFNNFIIKNFLIIFLFFYIFLWYLPQGGGYSGVGQFTENSSILKNTLFNEITNIFMLLFNFADHNIINLPRIVI